ncbi:hypothetical protein FVEG_09084 [Fusarium verticillioides 7600]|uniref:Uncharacterized protein n=1 Tax=Gibberella moniliformis (strain M3125 / FGSC 7600) TaxID=334819 RepID=W7MDH8_GIBM7|nr:hypothetical protein FVEG_09084 [Fusarium verticillioides 7600]EWG49598.1 hypothetical protein FVEG_09084 [Fusarium verticillioides 7600]
MCPQDGHAVKTRHSTVPFNHTLLLVMPTTTWRVDPLSAKQGSAVGFWPPNQSRNAAPHHRRHTPPSQYTITLARHCTQCPGLRKTFLGVIFFLIISPRCCLSLFVNLESCFLGLIGTL